jgi:hypothetical protein
VGGCKRAVMNAVQMNTDKVKLLCQRSSLALGDFESSADAVIIRGRLEAVESNSMAEMPF